MQPLPGGFLSWSPPISTLGAPVAVEKAGAGGFDVLEWAAAYAYPSDPPDGRWLRANMVSTVDGAAVSPDGVTRAISSTTDRELMAVLRALADVILVGASTAVREGYGPDQVRGEHAHLRAAAGLGPGVPIAVVSNRLDLDLDSPLFAAGSVPTILLTTSEAPSDRLLAARMRRPRIDVAVVGESVVDPAAAVAALVERGHRRMLCEGGPRWLTSLVAAGLLDELCLTVSPLLLGGEAFRVLGPAPLGEGVRVRLGQVNSDGANLFLRYLIGNRPARR
jgi:riboflavin biosynthesis pyrimidine reductase